MIIDVTGFGWSGSGAILDLLKEYNDLYYPLGMRELSILHMVDGIKDLEYKVVEKNCRIYDVPIAIRRFLTLAERLNNGIYKQTFNGDFYKISKEYIESMKEIIVLAPSSYDAIYCDSTFTKVNILYNRILNKFFKIFLPNNTSFNTINHIMRSNRVHNKILIKDKHLFYKATHDYINRLLLYVRKGNKPLILDHFFSPDCPQIFFNLIGEDVRCIVVRRDPRDTYILAKETLRGNSSIPVDNIENYIWFYKNTIQETKQQNTDKVLSINYEDLIYNYEKTKSIIEEFLQISSHDYPKKYFNPNVSINNTQLFRKYAQYENDIHRIEESLSPSLFEYEKYNLKPNFATQVF